MIPFEKQKGEHSSRDASRCGSERRVLEELVTRSFGEVFVLFFGLVGPAGSRAQGPHVREAHPGMCVLVWACLCVLLGLLPPEIQTRALTGQTSTHRLRHRWPVHPEAPVSSLEEIHLPESDAQLVWRALLHREPPPLPAADHAHEGSEVRRPSRGRRHVNSVGGRAHLMRVGCVLGTCQVQNLSHRLYQLIGQSGREDSSPINPRSPHSYG